LVIVMGCVGRRFPFPVNDERYASTDVPRDGEHENLNKASAEDRYGDRSSRRMSWLWFSCLALLLLLPHVSFAKTHLWKYRPFRANDTDHSGGDHICDLRRDSNADGKPDRLGDYVTVSGTVIVEPSTFETGGWLFWIRECGCGILVYGEQENLRVGDSVTVNGWVRLSDGNYFFPETGLATIGDITLENAGVTLVGVSRNVEPRRISPEDYALCAASWGGALVALSRPARVSCIMDAQGDRFAWVRCGRDSLIVYMDEDTACSLTKGRCYLLTGVVVRMLVPIGSTTLSIWSIAPRSPADIAEVGCSTNTVPTALGRLKSRFSPELAR
jgi:hypothetical protein